MPELMKETEKSLTNKLAIGAGVVALIPYLALLSTSGISAFLLTTPLWWSAESWGASVTIGSTVGMVGVVASALVLWSSRHEGRRSGLGLALGGLYAIPLIVSPFGLAPFHLFTGPVLLVLVAAVVNHRRKFAELN